MSPPAESTLFAPGVELALRAALEAHDGQVRKGSTAVPYITHPVRVALMVSGVGFDGEVIQAALLHDVVEDCEGWSLARVRRGFGERVAGFVGELTEDKSRSWQERKQAAIDHAPRLSPEAAVIKACDQLHNLGHLLSELREVEDEAAVWARFNGGRVATLAMARGLVDALAPRVPPVLGRELRETMKDLEAEAG